MSSDDEQNGNLRVSESLPMSPGSGGDQLCSHSPLGAFYFWNNPHLSSLSEFELDFLLFMGESFKGYNLSQRHMVSNFKDDSET